MLECQNKRLIEEASNAWEALTLANNFLFQKVMQNEELCVKVLSEILGVEVEKVIYTDYEKTIDVRLDAKAIRLDVYIKDEKGTVYNIEMQNTDMKDLPKRGRYYQGLIDMDLLEKGNVYSELNKSIIIFICTFDYYKMGLYKYTFNNICREDNSLEYGDETTKIVVNTHGTKGEITKDMRVFLDAINGVFSNDEFSDKLKMEVEKVKRSEHSRRDYMTLYIHDQDIRRLALEEGREEGRTEGIKEGIKGIIAEYLSEGKSEDIIVQKLMRIYNLNEYDAKEYFDKYK